jgi:hypothetical protein
MFAASAQGEWIGDYGEALRACRTTRRPLLIVLEDPSARVAARHISYRPEAQQIQLLDSYICCRIDVSTPYGRKVADAFRAKTYPTAVVIDKTASRILARKNGYHSASDWSNFLAAHQTGQAPASRPAITYPAYSSPAGCFT